MKNIEYDETNRKVTMNINTAKELAIFINAYGAGLREGGYADYQIDKKTAIKVQKTYMQGVIPDDYDIFIHQIKKKIKELTGEDLKE